MSANYTHSHEIGQCTVDVSRLDALRVCHWMLRVSSFIIVTVFIGSEQRQALCMRRQTTTDQYKWSSFSITWESAHTQLLHLWPLQREPSCLCALLSQISVRLRPVRLQKTRQSTEVNPTPATSVLAATLATQTPWKPATHTLCVHKANAVKVFV